MALLYPLFLSVTLRFRHSTPLNVAHCQLSRGSAIAALANKYSVPAVFTHAKHEKIPQTPTIHTARAL